MTPEETAAQRVTAVLAERDAVQANLLELDGSFAKQVLEGAALTGQTRDRWAAASAALATLWETFLAYSAVVDRVAALGTGAKRPARKDLPELNELLTGGCVQLPGAPVPLARRDLASAGRPPVTLAAAVGAMRRAFTEVTEVTSAVEAVWAAVGRAARRGDRGAGPRPAAGRRPRRGHPGGVPRRRGRRGGPARRRQRRPAGPVAAVAGRGRPAGPRATGASTPRPPTGCASRSRRSPRGSPSSTGCGSRPGTGSTTWRPPPRPPARPARTPSRRGGTRRRGSARCRRCRPRSPTPPLASLGALAAGGQWSRLAAELDRCEAELAAAAARDRRACARRRRPPSTSGTSCAGCCAPTRPRPPASARPRTRTWPPGTTQAYGLLWTAPCDLAAAEAAVAAYQRAILATEGRR